MKTIFQIPPRDGAKYLMSVITLPLLKKPLKLVFGVKYEKIQLENDNGQLCEI